MHRPGVNQVERTSRRGFTLVEAVICMLIVATMFAAAMATVAGAAQARMKQAGWRKAGGLSQMLLAEIQASPYGSTSGSIAPLLVLGSPPTDRTTFDDVDDYHDFSESPPKDRLGNPLAGYDGWSWRALVERVDPADPLGASTRSTDKGMKRVTVEVRGPTRRGSDSITQTLLRSRWSFADQSLAPGASRAQGINVQIEMSRGGRVAVGALMANGPTLLSEAGADGEVEVSMADALGSDKRADTGGGIIELRTAGGVR